MIQRLWPLPAVSDVDDAMLTNWLATPVLSGSETLVRMNFVSSIDGSAGNAGDSGTLSGEADKRVFEILRRVSDVVLVGAGTVRAEGYGPMRVSAESARWRLADGRPEHPVFAVASGRADLDPASRIFTDAPVRPIVLTTADADSARREQLAKVADVVICGNETLDPALIVAALSDRGLGRVICEGGPQLHGSLLAASVVDEMFLTVSPVLSGPGGLGRITAGDDAATGQPMLLKSVLTADGFLMLRYQR